MLLSELERKLCFDIPKLIPIRGCIHVSPNHIEYFCSERHFLSLLNALKTIPDTQLHFIGLKEMSAYSPNSSTNEAKSSPGPILLVLELLSKDHYDITIRRFFISVLCMCDQSTLSAIKQFIKNSENDLFQL